MMEGYEDVKGSFTTVSVPSPPRPLEQCLCFQAKNKLERELEHAKAKLAALESDGGGSSSGAELQGAMAAAQMMVTRPLYTLDLAPADLRAGNTGGGGGCSTGAAEPNAGRAAATVSIRPAPAQAAECWFAAE